MLKHSTVPGDLYGCGLVSPCIQKITHGGAAKIVRNETLASASLIARLLPPKPTLAHALFHSRREFVASNAFNDVVFFSRRFSFDADGHSGREKRPGDEETSKSTPTLRSISV